MILTCWGCERQLTFRGRDRECHVALFGWSNRGGRYRCSACSAASTAETTNNSNHLRASDELAAQ